MSKYNYAPGAIHIDHHKDLNIDVKSVDDAIRLMSAFMSDKNVEDITPESTSAPASDNAPKDILPIPKEGKYTKVREYIKERSRYDEEFKNFVKEKSLRELCARLTKEFGWFVDEHSLGSNLNRHRKD